MVSSWIMTKVEEAARENVVSQDVLVRISKKISQSDWLVRPIAILVDAQVYCTVHVRMAEERFPNNCEHLIVDEEENVSTLYGAVNLLHSANCDTIRCKRKNDTD